MTSELPLAWRTARDETYRAGRRALAPPVELPLTSTDGLTLAGPLATLTDLPAFATSSVDGYATRGPGPWPVDGRVLAGQVSPALAAGTAVEIATGAMVPAGTEQIIRTEESTVDRDGRVSGQGRPTPEWREPGDEAAKGEELIPAGAAVTPGVIGLAAACGYDQLLVYPAPRVAVLVFGDELLAYGTPGDGRVRDSLGPQLPAWLRRLGARPVAVYGPVTDTLDAHVEALRNAISEADVVCTTGGTMHGPVDHLHPALAALGARYVVNTVAVRPGFPMLVAEIPRGSDRPAYVAGLPGNPQSAIVALMSLVQPLLTGLSGRSEPALGQVRLGAAVPGRGSFTHLALVRLAPDGVAYPVGHVGSSMLRGLAQSDGFAVIEPSAEGTVGSTVDFLRLP